MLGLKSLRKSTDMWTTATGRKIKIVDMTDSHLRNTIKMLEQYAKHMEQQVINAGESMLYSLQGEMAIESVEKDLDRLYQNGLDPCEISPIYCKLIAEANKRRLKKN